ncbi:MAG TPA: hypothetical protein VL854_02095 [Nitrososphaeraceae archaeon]|nr:hypothetical protein [Nitrososphaeraceae archaeon]
MIHRDIRSNPTANHRLQHTETKYNPIKSSVNDLKDLNILCTRCTVFDKDKALKKMYMVHDGRNELYRCPQCNNVHSENQIRNAMRLELPEYIYYDKSKNINDVKRQREEEEKFIIQPINAQSPTDLLKKTSVRAVKNNPLGTDPRK